MSNAARPQTRRDVDEPLAAINAISIDIGSCPSENLLQVDKTRTMRLMASSVTCEHLRETRGSLWPVPSLILVT